MVSSSPYRESLQRRPHNILIFCQVFINKNLVGAEGYQLCHWLITQDLDRQHSSVTVSARARRAVGLLATNDDQAVHLIQLLFSNKDKNILYLL